MEALVTCSHPDFKTRSDVVPRQSSQLAVTANPPHWKPSGHGKSGIDAEILPSEASTLPDSDESAAVGNDSGFAPARSEIAEHFDADRPNGGTLRGLSFNSARNLPTPDRRSAAFFAAAVREVVLLPHCEPQMLTRFSSSLLCSARRQAFWWTRRCRAVVSNAHEQLGQSFYVEDLTCLWSRESE